MASKTEQAFNGRPQQVQSTYQRNITPPSTERAKGGVSSGYALARSLGILGDAIAAEGVAGEKRKEKIGIAAADEIISGQTPENLQKLSAVEMLQNYGHFDQKDNPYAIATIEKMRGKYFGAKTKDEYTEYRKEQKQQPKTPDEEIRQYSKFVQDKFTGLQNVSSDSTAFHRGFFDSDLANQLDVAKTRQGEIADERKTLVAGSVAASLGEIGMKAGGMTSEDLVKNWNTVFADARLVGSTIPERIKFAREGLKTLVTQTGDVKKLDEIANNVIIGVDRDGKPQKLGSVVDLADYRVAASQRQGHMFGERIQQSLGKLLGGTQDQANMQFKIWEKTDPDFFNVMVPYADNTYNTLKKREEKVKMQALNDETKRYVDQAGIAIIDQQFKAYTAGARVDAQGNRLATSPGDLPKIKYTQYNLDGSTVEKEQLPSEKHISSYIDYQVQQLKADKSKTSEQRGALLMQLLASPIAEKHAATLAMIFSNEMDAVTVDKLDKDSAGKTRLSGNLQDALVWYRTDPEKFYQIFKEDATRKVEAIQTLEDATGDIKEAVGLCANGRDKMKDKDFTRQVYTNISKALLGKTIEGFMDLTGNVVSVKSSLGDNSALTYRVRSLATQLTYAGIPFDTAVTAATVAARKTQRIWRDTVIPVDAFNGINSSDRAKVGGEVLDYYLKQFTQDTGVNEQHVVTSFNSDRGVFTLSGGGGFVTYNLNDIAYSGNYMLLQRTTNSAPVKNITMEEVEEARKKPDETLNPMTGEYIPGKPTD